MKHFLFEDNRNQFLNKSRSSVKGKQRFERRKKSKVQNTVASMNGIDMDKLFKKDALTIDIPVHGETDDYKVKITYIGLLELLRNYVQRNNGVCTLREISKACIDAFNSSDVLIDCTCPDFQYRFRYYRTQQGQNSGEPETRPSNITNPHDTLGSGCKHVLLVLSNNSWVLRVARVINNYIKYMEQHYQRLYADIIYPAIYGKEYEEPVQLSFDDINNNSDELATDSDTISAANTYNQQRTRFQKGNQSGIQFASSRDNPDQIPLENPDDEL